MAYTFAVNPITHDLAIDSNGQLLTISGSREVQQRIIISLLHTFGEYFLNTPSGLPWYELMLGSKNKNMVEMLCRQAILDVPGVISIVSCQVIFPASSVVRGLSLSASVEVSGDSGSNIVNIIASIG